MSPNISHCPGGHTLEEVRDPGPLGRFLAGGDIVLQRLNFTLLRLSLSNSRVSAPTLLRKKVFRRTQILEFETQVSAGDTTRL